MTALLSLAATAFAVPQLLPQLQRIRRVGPEGVSAQWALLTAVGNAAWLTWFVRSGIASGAIPTGTSLVLAVGIAVAMRGRGALPPRAFGLPGLWALALLVTTAVGGTTALGTALTGAFVLQVTPSLVAAWRSPDPVGVSRLTWVLIAAEVTCWGVVGATEGRAPLIALGLSGWMAAGGMLWLSRPSRRPLAAART